MERRGGDDWWGGVGGTCEAPKVLVLMVSYSFNWASMVAQTVKNLSAIQETWVQSLGWEDPLKKGMETHSQYSCLENPMNRGAWWVAVMGSQRVRHD